MKDINNLSSKNTTSLESFVNKFSTTKKIPPVEQWEPDFCGDMDMVIKRDGSWIYMGTPILRKELVQLFATVLRKDEDGKTYLVTPVEKIGITVEDAPFLAVEMENQGTGKDQVLTFRTNTNDVITASNQNPLRFEIDPENQGLKPYLLVRGRLEALLTRAITYELLELGTFIARNDRNYFTIYSSCTCWEVV